MGEFPLDAFDQRLERPRRAGQESVRAGSESLWVELGLRWRGLGESLHGGDRHGDRWIDRLSVGRERYRWHQADARAVESERDNSDCPQSGYCRPDDAYGA